MSLAVFLQSSELSTALWISKFIDNSSILTNISNFSLYTSKNNLITSLNQKLDKPVSGRISWVPIEISGIIKFFLEKFVDQF